MKHAKPKIKIPANIDPIKLADDIKSGITTEWIKRRKAIKHELKPLLVQKS